MFPGLVLYEFRDREKVSSTDVSATEQQQYEARKLVILLHIFNILLVSN